MAKILNLWLVEINCESFMVKINFLDETLMGMFLKLILYFYTDFQKNIP